MLRKHHMNKQYGKQYGISTCGEWIGIRYETSDLRHDQAPSDIKDVYAIPEMLQGRTVVNRCRRCGGIRTKEPYLSRPGTDFSYR